MRLLVGLCLKTLLQHVVVLILIGSKTCGEATEFVQHPSPTVHSTKINGGKEAANLGPPGHLLPLGSHRPPEKPGIDVLHDVPDPQDFFAHYVKNGRPVVFKGAARNMAAYRLWRDEYLSEHYGHLEVEVEEGKKENRSKDLWHMRLSQYIKNYQEQDVYLVTDVPEQMEDEFCLLRCLMCGGFTQALVSTVMWYSSGGTKSVLHFDSVDNINCVLDGRKEIFFVDKREEASIDIDHPGGSFSGVDVERVDLNKYPGLGRVPWYNATLEKGDCLFIPYRWFHSVQSEGRNLAVNVWFVHQQWFNSSDCPDDLTSLPEFLPLSRVKTRANQFLHLRSELAHEIDKRSTSLSLDRLQSLLVVESQQEEAAKMFHALDSDGDMQLTMAEIYVEEFNEICESAGLRFTDEGDDEEKEEYTEDDEIEEEEMEEYQVDEDGTEEERERTHNHQRNDDEHEEL